MEKWKEKEDAGGGKDRREEGTRREGDTARKSREEQGRKEKQLQEEEGKEEIFRGQSCKRPPPFLLPSFVQTCREARKHYPPVFPQTGHHVPIICHIPYCKIN